MAYLKISKHNPVALRQSNSNYEAIKPLFCDLLKDFEHYVEYYQKYQNSDTINVQYSTDDITTTATMKLVSCSNSYNFTISQITPNIEYVGDKRFYKSTLDLASVVEGYYQIHFDIEIDSKTYYFTSEPIYIKSAHDNTMLLKYTHDLNQYDMLFLNSLGNNEFYLRVEGGCKQSDISPNSKDSIFIGMNYDSVQLDARPYPLYKFTFGDCLGLPFWLIEIINNAISLNEVYFDDIRYSKNEGAKLEKEQIDNDNYPLNLYTVEMLKVPTDYSIDVIDYLEEEIFLKNIRRVGDLGLTISFITGAGRPVYTFDWGDNTQSTHQSDLLGNFSATHTYAEAGTYNVKISATDEDYESVTYIGLSEENITEFYGNSKMINVTNIEIKINEIANYNGNSDMIGIERLEMNNNHMDKFEGKIEWVAIETILLNSNDLTSVIMPEWTTITTINLQGNQLQYFENKPEWIDLTTLNLKANRLLENEVNNILIIEDAKGLTKTATIDLSGGYDVYPNAAPTGAGITAKNNLISRGYTVITN